MTRNRQMTRDNREGAKTNSLRESMTLLGKRVRSKSKGQCSIDKGQLQYDAHVRCDLELGMDPRIFPIWAQNYDITTVIAYIPTWDIVHCSRVL